MITRQAMLWSGFKLLMVCGWRSRLLLQSQDPITLL